MATRFWLTSAAPPYTPTTRRGAWDVAAGEDIQLLGRKPQGSAGTSSINVGSTAADRDVLLHRSISAGAIKAGTISGTVEWTIGVKESNVDLNGFWHLHIYVTSGDSDTPRGTLLTDYIGATEFTTTATGTDPGAQTVTPVAVQVGDRLVVEIGYRANALATTYNATINYGNVGTTDLAATDTAVTTEPGWVEFSGADGLFTPSFSTLTDAFPSSIDAKWTKTTNVTATGGRARIPTTTTLEDLYTATAYQIQGGQVAFQVPTLPATGGGTGAAFSAYLSAGPTVSTTNLEITYSPNTGNLQFRNNIGGSDGSPTTVAYNATSHAWWRFKESGGSILMETSPDNATWTTQRTISTITQWMRLGTLIFYCESQRTSGTADFAEIDSINVSNGTSAAAGPSAETSTAQAAARAKRATATNAAETATARPPAPAKTRSLTPPGSVDTAQAPARAKTATAGRAGSTDTAQPAGRSKSQPAGRAAGIETAQQPGRAKATAIAPAGEADAAQPVGHSKARTAAPAGSIEAAQPVKPTKAVAVPVAAVVETARPASAAKRIALAAAVEVDGAHPAISANQVAAGPASELVSARPAARRKALAVSAAIEVSAAQAAAREGAAVRDLTFTVAGPLLHWAAVLSPGRWHADEQPNPWRTDLQ